MTGHHNNIGEQFRSGVKGIHGIGEAIRGTAMDTLDTALHTNSPDRKNKQIADQGFADMRAADNDLGRNHGINHSAGSTTTTNSNTQSLPERGA